MHPPRPRQSSCFFPGALPRPVAREAEPAELSRPAGSRARPAFTGNYTDTRDHRGLPVPGLQRELFRSLTLEPLRLWGVVLSPWGGDSIIEIEDRSLGMTARRFVARLRIAPGPQAGEGYGTPTDHVTASTPCP